MNDFDTLSFADEVRSAGDNLDPVRAGLYFAREIAYPDLDPSYWLAELQALADAARPSVSVGATVRAKVQALNHYMFKIAGFQGNRDDYYNPCNSFLNDVIANRCGIPITLSVIYVDIARRLGLPAKAIGLPGNFLAGVRNGAKRILVDSFAGRTLTESECDAMVRRTTNYTGAFQLRWLEPTPPREIVARMLNNLRSAYAERQAWPECITAVRLLRVLQPQSYEHTRDLGLLFYRSGQLRESIRHLENYLIKKPHASDYDEVKHSLGMMIDRVARLN